MSFRHWSIADCAKHNARVALVPLEPPAADAVPAGEEWKLHDYIGQQLRQMRWLFIHSRMDKRTTTDKGVPDFQIYPPQSKAFFIECKTKTGKLSPEQMAFKTVADLLGHPYHLVRSRREADEVFNQYKP